MPVGTPRRMERRAITHMAAATPTRVLATRRRGWARSSMAERHPEGRVLRLRRLGKRQAGWHQPASLQWGYATGRHLPWNRRSGFDPRRAPLFISTRDVIFQNPNPKFSPPYSGFNSIAQTRTKLVGRARCGFRLPRPVDALFGGYPVGDFTSGSYHTRTTPGAAATPCGSRRGAGVEARALRAGGTGVSGWSRTLREERRSRTRLGIL